MSRCGVHVLRGPGRGDRGRLIDVDRTSPSRTGARIRAVHAVASDVRRVLARGELTVGKQSRRVAVTRLSYRRGGLIPMRPCEVYVVRHAVAAARGDEWPDDKKRPLTERGASRFGEALDGLVWLGFEVDQIFSSPLVRARQTAELMAARLAGHPPITIVNELAPGHEPAIVRAQLAKVANRGRIAVVGHEPDLGEFTAYLIGASRALPIRKGGVCRIDLPGLSSGRPGSLIWSLPPKVLRRLGR